MKHGVLLIGLKESDSPNKILTKTEEVIKLKQKMKMNIILTIITIELKELFILQQAYLKNKTIKDTFYDDFDFYREWMFFCVCVYDKIIQTHKNNGLVKKEDIFVILENVKKNNVDFIREITKTMEKQPVVNVTDAPGASGNPVAKIKSWGESLKARVSASKTTIGAWKTNILSKIGIKPTPATPETTNDCVKKLFVDFMYILYLHDFNIEKFPLTININNPGDSTSLQEYFDDVVEQQRNYYNQKFDDIIKVEYLKAETFNTDDQVAVLERTNDLQTGVNASNTILATKTAVAPVSVEQAKAAAEAAAAAKKSGGSRGRRNRGVKSTRKIKTIMRL